MSGQPTAVGAERRLSAVVALVVAALLAPVWVAAAQDASAGHAAWAWGANGSGQLGDGTTTDRTTPVAVSGLAGVVAMDGGGAHSLAVTSDGGVLAWGANGYGQLGLGQLADGTTVDKSSPVEVTGISNIRAVSAGQDHSLAIDSQGTGTTSDDTLWAWGRNSQGKLGDGTNSDTVLKRTAPVAVVIAAGVQAVAAGPSYSLAVKHDGTVWAWGDRHYLGVPCAGPTSGVGFTSYSCGDAPVPEQVPGLVDVVAVAAGSQALALRRDGTVFSWGKVIVPFNSNASAPASVPGLAGVEAIASKAGHRLARTSDRTVWSWGANESGQLGDGTTTARNVPAPVPGLAGVEAIAAGGAHSLARTGDGRVHAWGSNSHGQLGPRSVPTTTTTLPVALPTTTVALSTTTTTTPATVTDTRPAPVTGLDDVVGIGAGALHSLAIRSTTSSSPTSSSSTSTSSSTTSSSTTSTTAPTTTTSSTSTTTPSTTTSSTTTSTSPTTTTSSTSTTTPSTTTSSTTTSTSGPTTSTSSSTTSTSTTTPSMTSSSTTTPLTTSSSTTSSSISSTTPTTSSTTTSPSSSTTSPTTSSSTSSTTTSTTTPRPPTGTTTSSSSTTTIPSGATTTTTPVATTITGDQVGLTVQLSQSTAEPGEQLTVSGSGLPAGELSIELFSSPVLLGTTTADAAGRYSATVVIPADTAPGNHRVVVSGPGGTPLAEAALNVVASRSEAVPRPAQSGTGGGVTSTAGATPPAPTPVSRGPLSRTGSDISTQLLLAMVAVLFGSLPLLAERVLRPRRAARRRGPTG